MRGFQSKPRAHVIASQLRDPTRALSARRPTLSACRNSAPDTGQDVGCGSLASMKTRAAIAFEAGKPLQIDEVDLEGPKAGEVLVEIKATGVCHTDELTRSGADPEGVFPVIFGHEGAGVVLDVGAGVTTVKPGDNVIPLYTQIGRAHV